MGKLSEKAKSGYRWTRKGWRKIPKPVRFATNFIPGLGGAKVGIHGYRLYRGGKALGVAKTTAKGKKYMLGFADTAKDVAFVLAGPTIASGGAYYWDKRHKVWKLSTYKSRKGSSSSSSQQSRGRNRGTQSRPSWAPSRRSSSIPRRRGRGVGFRPDSARRPPYCPVHKRKHWCWFTRKNKK